MLFGIPIGIESSAVGLKVCIINAEIKKYKSIFKKTKAWLLAKNMLNTIEILTSQNLIDSYISHDTCTLGNNILKEYDMKVAIKNPKTINKYDWYNKRNINLSKWVSWYELWKIKKKCYIESSLIDSDGNMYLAVDSLIKV